MLPGPVAYADQNRLDVRAERGKGQTKRTTTRGEIIYLYIDGSSL